MFAFLRNVVYAFGVRVRHHIMKIFKVSLFLFYSSLVKSSIRLLLKTWVTLVAFPVGTVL